MRPLSDSFIASEASQAVNITTFQHDGGVFESPVADQPPLLISSLLATALFLKMV